MGHWERKGLGELIEDPLSFGSWRRNLLVIVECNEYVGTISYPPVDGELIIDMMPDELCRPVPGGRVVSPQDIYELLRSHRHETGHPQLAAWVFANYFAGSRSCRYTNRLLAWAYGVLMVRFGKEGGLASGASVASMIARNLVYLVADDIDRMSANERAALDAVAPWAKEVADRMKREMPPFLRVDPSDPDAWETENAEFSRGSKILRRIVEAIDEPEKQYHALRALWPSVEDFNRALQGQHPTNPQMAESFTLHGTELIVVDQVDLGHRFPNLIATAALHSPTTPKLVSLADLEGATNRRKATDAEWEHVLYRACDSLGWSWQIPHICDRLAEDAAAPRPKYALFLIAHGRLYGGSSRIKRIGKALMKALKACDDAERNALCDRYPEAAALWRHRSKPEAVNWLEDWAAPMRAAIAWGASADTQSAADPARTPPAAQPKPELQRLSPKLQGAGQITARAKAAPMGVAHRLLESEWDVRADAFGELHDMTFRWLEDKLGIALTHQWRDGYHEFDHHGFRLETEQMPGLMAFRIEHPDVREPGRRWRVEGALLEPSTPDGTGVASIRLIAVDQFKTMAPPPYSMPGLAQRWLATGALSVLQRDPREVWILATNPDFYLFRNTAADAERPVGFLVTAGDCPDIPAQLVGTIVHAHLAPAMAGDYAKRFGGAPGAGEVHLFAANAVEPLTMPFGTRAEMEAAVRAATRSTRLPSFADIRQQIRAAQVVEARRHGAADAEKGVAAPAPAVTKVEQDTAALMDLAVADLDRANVDLATAQEMLAERDTELRQALHMIRALKLQLGEDVGQDLDEEAVPDDFEQLQAFAERLHPRLVVMPKALRSARDAADFQDKPLVFKALRALATHYWEMRFGDRDAGFTRWHEFLTEHRLTFGQVGHALDNQRFSDTYKVRIDGETLPLDLHLSGSSSRNPAKCLRVYLHADERRQRILVGHLPSHLPNTHT